MLADQNCSFNLSEWRAYMRGQRRSDSFLATLNTTFCALHDQPHQSRESELTCAALVEQLIENQFWGMGADHSVQCIALRQLAAKADELHHNYHSFAHVREVMLSGIALIDRYEDQTSSRLPDDFRFNVLITTLIHDIGHPGQKLAKNVETEAQTLGKALPEYCRYLSNKNNIEPIILGVLVTGQPFFASIEELNDRYKTHNNIINQSGLFSRINPMAHEHVLFTRIIGMADILPSLVSSERLMIGALKFVIEDGRQPGLDNTTQAALGFLGAVEKSPSPFENFGSAIPFEELRTGVRSAGLRRDITVKIEAFSKQPPVNSNTLRGP